MKYFNLAPFKQFSYIIPIVIGLALILSWAALFNGFPLVFSDTGIYLLAAIQGVVSWSHPIFYSYFVFPLHSLFSLWAIVFYNSFLFLYILYLTLRVIFQKFHLKYFIIITLLLSLLSSLSYQIAFILVDFYAALIIILFFLLGSNQERLNVFENIFCFTSLFLIITFHYSYLPLAFGLATVSLILFLLSEIKKTPIKKKTAVKNKIYSKTTKKAFILFSPIIIAASMFITIQLIYNKTFTINADSHPFLLAKLIADGHAKKYLTENCKNKDYLLCNYQEQISQINNPGDFLWNDSIIKKIGVTSLREEGKQIITGTLQSYPWLVLKTSLISTWNQLLHFNFPLLGTHLNSYIAKTISKDLSPPNSREAYINSRQNTNKLNNTTKNFNTIHTPIIYLSLIISCIFAIIAFKKQHNIFVVLFMLIIAGLFFNASISGTLSGISSRYQNRMIWLIPFYALIAGTYLFDCWRKQNHLNKK